MMDKAQKAALRALIQSPHWAILEQTAEKIVNNIRTEPAPSYSEWETIKGALLKEGQEAGIRRLLRELYEQANEA